MYRFVLQSEGWLGDGVQLKFATVGEWASALTDWGGPSTSTLLPLSATDANGTVSIVVLARNSMGCEVSSAAVSVALEAPSLATLANQFVATNGSGSDAGECWGKHSRTPWLFPTVTPTHTALTIAPHVTLDLSTLVLHFALSKSQPPLFSPPPQ
jgi:hypothetical protein